MKEEEWLEREYQDWLANKGALVYGEITVQVLLLFDLVCYLFYY